MALREARSVELFDAHISLSKTPSENLLHQYETFAAWQIDGDELDQLLQHLSVPVMPAQDWHFNHKTGQRVVDRENLMDKVLPLVQYVMENPYAEFDSYQIEAVLAEEVPGGLNLEVHGGNPGEPKTVDRFSYRGRYMIMWETEED